MIHSHALKLLSLLSVMSGFPVTASAQTPPNGLAINGYGKCLDVKWGETRDAATVWTWDCNATNAQVWGVFEDGTLRNQGRCLDVANNQRTPGAVVFLWSCNGGGNQKWAHDAQGRLVNPQSGLCLSTQDNTSNTAIAMQLTACGTALAQRWSLPTSTSTPMPLGGTGTWHLKFNDDFNGTTLDQTRWRKGWFNDTGISQSVNPDWDECYDPANVVLAQGMLQLKVEKRPIYCNRKTRTYAAAMVQSNNQYRFTYGFMEARMYLPGANGKIHNWPAFWAAGQDWPTTGEIDVMEGLDGPACYHFHYGTQDNHQQQGKCIAGDYTGWHVFGAQWQPGQIDFYYDGVLVGSITKDVTAAPLYLLVNNGANNQATVAPATVLVDYVRVWQR